MAGNRTTSGIEASAKNRSFEAALCFALNPAATVTLKGFAADLGLTDRQTQHVFRQLVQGDVAERIGRGQYRATAGLQRMVRLWTPEKAACCMDGLPK